MNASDIIADRLIQRGIYLERYKAGMNNRILALLSGLEDDLTRELAGANPTGILRNDFRRKRLEGLLAQVRNVIRRTYTEGEKISKGELERLARNEADYAVGAINETAGFTLAEITPTYEQLKKLVDETLIQDARSADWWARQGEDLTNRFSDAMRAGVLRGETLDELVARVRGTRAASFKDGIMQVPRRQAEALVRTSVQNVANAARRDTYQANDHVISAIQWISTLDSRTTPICVALNGKLWTTRDKTPIGHAHAYPGDTAHWNCRSTQLPVLKAWEDLMKEVDQEEVEAEFRKNLRAQGFTDEQIATIRRNTRASMDGQVAKDLSFDQWLGAKDAAFQDKLLGARKAQLFRDGKIRLTDLIDQKNRPLTLDELEALPQPRPAAPAVKLPGKRPRKSKPAGPPPRGEGDFPPLNEIELVRRLGGSTGAELVRDTQNGRLFVRKTGNSPDHIREEFAADQAYRAAGFNVPKAVLIETQAGPVKLAEYIEGQTLDVFLAKAPAEAQKTVLEQIRKGFVMDATLANYDVVGLSLDNVLVDAKGLAWRIDNGGALRFRAQGAAKTSAQWTGTVTELETMRNASINPAAARVFAPVTESEIEEQIRDLLTKKDAILAAVPPATREMMERRFASLVDRIETLVNEKLAADVRKSGVSGIRLVGDRDELEDVQLLIWTEKDAQGNPITMAKVKLTERGAEKVMAQIRDSIPKTTRKAAGPGPLPQDDFWTPILNAAKTVNTHLADGKFNVATLNALEAAKKKLAAMPAPTKALQEMKSAYGKMIQQIENSVQTKTATPKFEQFIPAPEKTPRAPKTAGRYKVSEENLTWDAKTFANGEATRTAGKVKLTDDVKHAGYVVDMGETNVRFIPFRGVDGNPMGNYQALFGQMEIQITGEATRQNVQRVIDTMKELGLNPTKASPDYLEAVWLRKTLQMRIDRVPPPVQARIREIMELDGIPDAQRVKDLRQIARDTLGIDPPTDPKWWTPTPNASGKGWGRTYRWDLPPDLIEKELKDYTLHHSTAARIPDLVESLLEQGGDFTSTAERLRKGVVKLTGMSPSTDLKKGGATHLYTRIKGRNSALKEQGFVFKVRNLARQDAFSFDSDWYGGVDNFFRTEQIYNARAKTVADLKRHAAGSSNETLFKWELNLLDDVEAIVVATDSDRKAVIAAFKKRGIVKFPDGRAVEQVVRTPKDPIP
jgi:SPP1 gp7 family putative phage head morphogenesis protein